MFGACRCRFPLQKRRLALSQGERLALPMSRVVREILLADGNTTDRRRRMPNFVVCQDLPIAVIAGSPLHVDRSIDAHTRGTVRCRERKHREQ